MRAIGIDCGLSGYVACINEGVTTVCLPTPTLPKGKSGRQYDDVAMVRLLFDMAAAVQHTPTIIVLEKQQAMPGQGVSSMFSVGLGFGLWRGIIAARAWPVLIVHPRTWQAVMLRDIPGDDTKARSIIACKRLMPEVSLRHSARCTKDDHNMADALLLARYGLLYLAGKAGQP